MWLKAATLPAGLEVEDNAAISVWPNNVRLVGISLVFVTVEVVGPVPLARVDAQDCCGGVEVAEATGPTVERDGASVPPDVEHDVAIGSRSTSCRKDDVGVHGEGHRVGGFGVDDFHAGLDHRDVR
jgi:hypothetical protein